jgi:nucleoside-diphosphate-sugar epimerase
VGVVPKVLVIGGSGFVGSALIPALCRLHCDLVVLNRGNRPLTGVKQIIADRNDAKAMMAHSATFDVVIDTSAYTRYQTEIAYRSFGRVARLWIHLGSAAVYSEASDVFPTEVDRLGGAVIWGEYGRNKAEAERYLLENSRGETVILRPPYLYGPKNDNDRETFVWSRVLNGTPIIVPGRGTARLQFLHVADLADLICWFVDVDWDQGGVFNVAAPEVARATEWVTMLAEIAQSPFTILRGSEYAPGLEPRSYFPFRDYDCVVDTTKLRKEVAWRPRFTMLEGFTQTFKGYSSSNWTRPPHLSSEESLVVARFGANSKTGI